MSIVEYKITQEEGKGRGDCYNLMPRALHNPGPAKFLHDMINLAVHQLIYIIFFVLCSKLVQRL
jgi:hypothetical protein